MKAEVEKLRLQILELKKQAEDKEEVLAKRNELNFKCEKQQEQLRAKDKKIDETTAERNELKIKCEK